MKKVRALSVMFVAAALLTSIVAAPAGAAGPVGGTANPVDSAASTNQCSLVDFDSATVKEDAGGGKSTLVVDGIKPYRFAAVELRPVVYFRQPDYWLIMVSWCAASEIDLPVLTPYVATLDISATIGTEGIEVRGANQQVKIPVKRVR